MEIKPIILNCVKFISEGMVTRNTCNESTTDRQERVPGFNQEKEENVIINLIGAGGLGGEIGEGLVRKGVRNINIYDNDVVDSSNLSRQRFYVKDLFKNKAISLAENLSKESIKRSLLKGIPVMFQAAVEKRLDYKCDVAICGVDNNPARTFVAKHYYKLGIPIIFTAVSRDADHGYVFVQEPGKACFGCLFPNAINDETHPCPNVPAVKDILKIMGGMVLYAVDTLIMDRKRNWNYKEIFLSGFDDRRWNIEKKKDCPLCGEL